MSELACWLLRANYQDIALRSVLLREGREVLQVHSSHQVRDICLFQGVQPAPVNLTLMVVPRVQDLFYRRDAIPQGTGWQLF